MLTYPGITPVDYLIIGHILQDLTPEGTQIGGTAAYSGLTAAALGQRVGVVTSWGEESGTEELSELKIANFLTEHSTTFENQYTPEGRVQLIHHLAPALDFYHIPESWRSTPIVQLAPMAGEIPPNLVRMFPEADLFLTAQGWLRSWDEKGRVEMREWVEASYMLPFARAVVISEEDVGGDLDTIYQLAASTPVLAVTKGPDGADIYAAGQVHRIPAPEYIEVDPTGAGDIFAAAFFTQLSNFSDPVRAAEVAVAIASDSITRPGLSAAPNYDRVTDILRKVHS